MEHDTIKLKMKLHGDQTTLLKTFLIPIAKGMTYTVSGYFIY